MKRALVATAHGQPDIAPGGGLMARLCYPVVTNYRLSKSVGTAYGQQTG